MGQRRLIALASVAIAGLVSGRALASPFPRTVLLEAAACEGSVLDVAEARRSVRAELEADGVIEVLSRSDGASAEASLTLMIGCDVGLTTRVVLKVTNTGREVERGVALADADRSARARALALAVSELVRSEWGNLVASAEVPGASASKQAATPAAAYPPEPAVAGASASASPSPVTGSDAQSASVPPNSEGAAGAQRDDPHPKRAAASALERDARWALSADARMRWFFDYASVSAGGALGLDHRAIRLRAETLIRIPEDPLGAATLGSAAACIGYRVLDAHFGKLRVSAYPMGSAGLTWLRGTAQGANVSSHSTMGFYGDVRLVVEGRLQLASLALNLGAELGRATGFLARSGTRVIGATGGSFVGVNAGAEY